MLGSSLIKHTYRGDDEAKTKNAYKIEDKAAISNGLDIIVDESLTNERG